MDAVQLAHSLTDRFGHYLINQALELLKDGDNRLGMLALFSRLVHKDSTDETIMAVIKDPVAHALITDSFILGMLAKEEPEVYASMITDFKELREQARQATL